MRRVFPLLILHWWFNPSAPFKSVKDLVAYAKVSPGKLVFASNGEGAFIHLTIEQLRIQAGLLLPARAVLVLCQDTPSPLTGEGWDGGENGVDVPSVSPPP